MVGKMRVIDRPNKKGMKVQHVRGVGPSRVFGRFTWTQGGLEKRFSNYRDLLLFQKTQDQSPNTHTDLLTTFWTPAPQDLILSSGLCWHGQTYTCAYTQGYTCTWMKLKDHRDSFWKFSDLYITLPMSPLTHCIYNCMPLSDEMHSEKCIGRWPLLC